MHGGRSTGPRTADGIARLRTARTIHGHYSAEARARRRHVLTMLRRGSVLLDALRYAAGLPPEMVARLDGSPPELAQPRPSAGGLSRAEDRAVMRAEAEALASWRHAIALARPARRRRTPRPSRSDRAKYHAAAGAHAPEPAAIAAAASGDRAGAGNLGTQAEGHAPEQQSGTAATRAGPAGVDNIRTAAKAHTPWTQAIALAKEAGRRDAAPPAGSDRTDPRTGAKAHTPEQSPAARSDPAATGDAGAREEAHATEQRMVATVASTVPVASGDGLAKAKPPAPKQATDIRQWNGIRLRPPSQAISLRRQLLAATHHDNLTAWAARVAGWGMIAEAVTTLGAAPPI